MKKLISIIFILVLIWVLVQLYAKVSAEGRIGHIPYIEEIEDNAEHRRMLLIVNKKKTNAYLANR